MKLSHIKNKRTLVTFICCSAIVIAGAVFYKKAQPASAGTPSSRERDAKIAETGISPASSENSFFITAPDEKIPALIQTYFKAKLEVDQTTLDKIVISDHMDYNKLQREIEYIKSYQNIITYVTEGINEIDYIVYVRYDVEFPKTSSYAPAMDEYYIVYNDKNDSYQIYMNALSEETAEYILKQREMPQVSELITSVTDQLYSNLEADPNLLDIYNSFLNGSK